MVPSARSWTRDEVLALPEDGNRYELIDGELLVTPSPRMVHQLAVQALFERIAPWVRANRIGTTCLSPADLDLQSGQLSQPDLFVVGLVGGREAREWSDCPIPLLVAEVVSPTTARFDRIVKRRRYQRSGVPLYWIVDLDARMVEAWTPAAVSPTIADRLLEWRPDPAGPLLVIDLAALFDLVLGSA